MLCLYGTVNPLWYTYIYLIIFVNFPIKIYFMVYVESVSI